ncbi:MAG: LUD domain-containing protein [Desulfobacca sp.]|uniref:LUD domain-containing protein n=1 Tax=Desulfobacca sp. TaxID=2067990 RepID=UPI0040493CA7
MLEPNFPFEIPAIRAAAQRALAARERIVATCPDWEAWRQQAHAIKAEVIAHLDDYLAELETIVRGWGGEVRHAADAGEARECLLDLARRHGSRLVVKAKSMTCEEVGLTAAFTAAGLEVVETDLGEFIVQLAGDVPSHLTAPAMHLNRRDIGRLFAKRLHLPRQTEPENLSRQGAAYLRSRFWQAELGITGVNFAAAASGHLVMLENEGNLRLAAAAPPVHIALMGLEKVIPRLADLQVFLRLLPASATGQRLTAYVNFFAGLKPQPQGWQAFYLVLLDNGRRRLAADTHLREALYCLRCGACLNICPIFQVGGGHLYHQVYPGAIGIILAAYLGGQSDRTDLCTQCGACSQICPVGIDLAAHISRLRRGNRSYPWLRALVRGAGFILQHPSLYRHLAPLGRQLWRQVPAGRQAAWWGIHRQPPEMPPRSFYELQQAAPPLKSVEADKSPP